MSIYPSEQQTEIKIIFNELNLTQKQLELVKKIIKASRNQISSPQDVKEIKLPIVVEFLAQLESKSKRLSNRLKNNPEIKSEQIVTLQKIPSIIKASSQYNQKEITSSSLILTFALPIISLSLHLKSEAELETEYNINFKELVRKLQRYSNPVKNYLKVFFIALLLFFPIIMERITSLEVFLKWELKVFDTLTQRKPFEKPDSHLLIVEVTDDDLQRYGYPIPDNTLSQLINRLQRHQPAIIGINILRLNKVENDDKVIYVCNHQIETNDPNSRGDSAPSDVSNDHIGFSDIIEDSDNVIRRHLLFQKPYATSPCQTPFSFSFLLAAYYLEDKGIEAKDNSRRLYKVRSNSSKKNNKSYMGTINKLEYYYKKFLSMV
ncbi:CHASE2 domain-containing protein [Aphanothece sacrum]|uniref:CHASE2 domain-containing protein n=1 Tax=Aphanothece sacrum TaxID=1122 RepID=UPI000F60EE3A|nr:CHASE2 domain-containing protein [Aphanothece sacrum]GBF83521.1 hypothetical protein AsFPU3_0563 [Aphanothece sacrum FPU3]